MTKSPLEDLTQIPYVEAQWITTTRQFLKYTDTMITIQNQALPKLL